MSRLLDEIIQQRKQETIDYQEYLANIKDLASKVTEPSNGDAYPNAINTRAKQALYDNLDKDETLAVVLDEAVHYNKLDGWRDGGIKEKKLMLAVNQVVGNPEKTLTLMDIMKAQSEY